MQIYILAFLLAWPAAASGFAARTYMGMEAVARCDIRLSALRFPQAHFYNRWQDSVYRHFPGRRVFLGGSFCSLALIRCAPAQWEGRDIRLVE
jgi:hypothetical protein